MKNVIDLTQRLAKQKGTPKKAKTQNAPVIDMTERREEILSAERRKVRRTILSEFIGAFAVVPRKGLLKVALYDVSENGMAFDVDVKAGQFAVGEEVALRVYLNQQTYFTFIVRVQNVRAVNDEEVYRHGAGFVTGTINDEALHHFVKFIETVSASLQSDKGDIMVSSIAR
ncbi:MAG TPA: PilZ domain-containing protein [Bdellovibrionales bacterium]|nr:PilZ domain-containing protein [Bdellovibrionales bacterium]